MAKIEGHADIGAVELVGDPQRIFDAGEPETGMRIQRDLYAIGPGGIGDGADLREHKGIGFSRRYGARLSVGAGHFVDGQPKHGMVRPHGGEPPAQAFIQRGFCGIEIDYVVTVKKRQALRCDCRGHGLVGHATAEAVVTEFAQHGRRDVGPATGDVVHGEKGIGGLRRGAGARKRTEQREKDQGKAVHG